MSMNQEFVIIAELPEPLRSKLESLRQQHDRWSTSWLPSHITMAKPTRDLPAKLLAKAADLRYPFRVTLGDWQAFKNPGANVIWLDPGQDEPTKVAKVLHHDYPELNSLDNGRYVPGQPHIYHITVVANVPDQDFLPTFRKLHAIPVMGECQIEQLSVYRRNLPNGHWKLVT